MTILDMLDQLEAEIVNLRARISELEASPRDSSKKPAKKKAAKKASTKKKAKKAASKRTQAAPEQLELVDGKAESPRPPVVGKRQALGRSIIQLRRPKVEAKG